LQRKSIKITTTTTKLYKYPSLQCQHAASFAIRKSSRRQSYAFRHHTNYFTREFNTTFEPLINITVDTHI